MVTAVQKASRCLPRNVFASLNEDGERELVDLKLPSSIRVQSKRFDPATYKVEEPIKYKNDKGLMLEKYCSIDNIIRWRYAAAGEKEGVPVRDPAIDEKLGTVASDARIETNAKVVRWSDGSYSLAIGEEMFDIQVETINKTYCFSQFETFSLLKEKVTRKMTAKPNLKSTSNHRKFIKRINDQNRSVVGALVSAMDDDKGLSWVDSDRKQVSLEMQAIPEKSIKKRSFQEAKRLMESNEEEELKQQQAKRAKASSTAPQTKERKSMSGGHHANDVVQSGSEEEYRNVDQMNKRRFDDEQESDSDSSSDSSSSDEDESI